MALFFVVAAILNLCVGCAVGMYVGCRYLGSADTEASPPDSQRSTVTLDPQQIHGFLDSLHELAGSVGNQIEQHSGRVAAISGHLSRATGDDATAILAAATALLTANRELQTELASARSEIHEKDDQLRSYAVIARTDPLTSVANRRAFDDELNRRFAQAQRQQTAVSLLLVDIDHFKKFNDTYGHLAGDFVLRELARVLEGKMREMDVVARYGGEEFAVILPSTNLDEATRAAERLRGGVAGRVFRFEDNELRVTVSVGLAALMPEDEKKSLVQRADAALYAAKAAGRNCGYFHTGRSCEPIEARRRSQRSSFKRRQLIAPYDGKEFPLPEMFQEVVCKDVSAGGFSYIAPEPPESKQFVVALGSPQIRMYMVATVRNCSIIGSEISPLFRVGCEFTNRFR